MHQNIAAYNRIEWKTVRQNVICGHDELNLVQTSHFCPFARYLNCTLLAIERHHMSRATDCLSEKKRHVA